MGTNYEHVQDVCPTCGHAAKRRHIGKSLVMFQAAIDWEHFVNDEPCLFLTSWQEWKAALLFGGTIHDEYGETLTPANFIAKVEATDPANRRRHFDWMAENQPHRVSDGPAIDKDWLDVDGFSFTTSEFS